MPKKENVQKRRPRPARSITKPGDDHELGLWIDYDLLRKSQNHTRTILHEHSASTNNRYLELADLALGHKKSKKARAAAGNSSGE